MRVTIEAPDSLPQERLQQRIKEIEESLREEAKFLITVSLLRDNLSDRDISSIPQTWLGSMADSGKITGEIL